MISFKQKDQPTYSFKVYSKILKDKFDAAVGDLTYNSIHKLSIKEIDNNIIVLIARTEAKDLENIYAELLACEILVNFAKEIYFDESSYGIQKESYKGQVNYILEVNKQDHIALYDLIDRLEIN